jgi:hypothetical protein
LGAAGEWNAVLYNVTDIVTALSKCKGSAMKYYYWTSTQYGSFSSWYMNRKEDFLSYSNKYENTDNCVRAFAALKSDGEESGGGEVKLINFTIDGVSYQADESMTWADWVDSAYNTNGFHLLSGNVFNLYGQPVGFGGNKVTENEFVAPLSYQMLAGGGGQS